MPPRTIALLGGSFDPPGAYHRTLAGLLSEQFDAVVAVPGKLRPERTTPYATPPVHRAAMTDLTFKGLDKVRVDLSGLEAGRFPGRWDLHERYSAEGRVAHVVPCAFVRNGAVGESLIHREWERGPELWKLAEFVVLVEPGESLDPADLPPHSRIVHAGAYAASAVVRGRIYHRQSYDELVVPRVADYIRRHGLYLGMPTARGHTCCLVRPRFHVFADVRPRSQQVAERYRQFEAPDPDLIVVVGGDGTMLHAIREHWRKRVPFYGINTGHLGFLLNNNADATDVPGGADFWKRDLLVFQLPLLHVESTSLSGQVTTRHAFNDAWVERASGQTAWVQLKVNGEVRLAKVVADGMLVGTAAGSTSYARAMGGAPIPFDTPVLQLVGSNVLSPGYWRSATLPIESVVEMTTLDPQKRPLQAYVDGVSQGEVSSMRVRVSNTAAAELAFVPPYDPTTKLLDLLFDG